MENELDLQMFLGKGCHNGGKCLLIFPVSDQLEQFGGFLRESQKVLGPRKFSVVVSYTFQEYVHWMMFWKVFSLVSMCEMVTDTMLSSWLPAYYGLKTLFLVWLVSPTTRGSITIYTKIVHPVMLRNEREIDRVLESLKEQSYRLFHR